MKLFIFSALVIAVVSQRHIDEYYPGFVYGNDPDNVLTKCTYWQGVESSVCHTKRFNVDNRSMKDFQQNYNMYGMMNSNDKLFGNAQKQPEPCSDDPDNFSVKCPNVYVGDQLDEVDGRYFWEPLSGCAPNETICRESCNLCGKENYITATTEVEKKTNLRCLKLMDHFPFSCMEKKVVETPLPSLFALFLSDEILEEDTYDETDLAMCVTFNFRRRASADCPLHALSEISVCTQKSSLYETFYESPITNCQVPFDEWTSANGEVREKLDDEHNCMFNIWRKAYFVFYNGPENPLSVADTLYGTQLLIVVYRNVDHIDIDDVEIFPGKCTHQIGLVNGLDIPVTPTPTGDGVFLGIKNIE